MYLARFETDAGNVVQGITAVSQAGTAGGWNEVRRALVAGIRIPGATVARRVTVEPGGRLHQLVALLAPESREPEVRAALAGLTRLERATGATVSLPQTRDEHDRWLADLPGLRYGSTAETFEVAGVPLACDFRVAPLLDELLLAAARGEYRLAYQVIARAFAPDPECVRRARKNALRLRELPGARDELVAWQEGLARGLAHADTLAEEYLAVDTPQAAAAVAAELRDAFRARQGRHGPLAPEIPFAAGRHEEPLLVGAHSHDVEPLGAVELCGVAVDAAERDRLLGWRPTERLLSALAVEREAAEPAPAPADSVPDLPAPYAGAGAFAFVSYKRQDLARIAPVLRAVAQLGTPIWFDRGIPGGAEWDSVIEERLSACAFVLFFVSAAAVASKYVRREVKFADALDIPVLSVLLEDAPLAHGMRMLVTQYQILDSRAEDFPARLRSAVDELVRRPAPAPLPQLPA